MDIKWNGPLWMGDPKPDCWQVIKTSQIQAKPEDILEGKSFDAIWKKDEETSVATVLKLGGMYYNCSYLIFSVVHLYLVQLSRWMVSLAFQFKSHELYTDLPKNFSLKRTNLFVLFLDSRSYLNTVRENDCARPWREAPSDRRVAVAKKQPEIFVLEAVQSKSTENVIAGKESKSICTFVFIN